MLIDQRRQPLADKLKWRNDSHDGCSEIAKIHKLRIAIKHHNSLVRQESSQTVQSEFRYCIIYGSFTLHAIVKILYPARGISHHRCRQNLWKMIRRHRAQREFADRKWFHYMSCLHHLSKVHQVFLVEWMRACEMMSLVHHHDFV